MKKILFGLTSCLLLLSFVFADSWLDELQENNAEMIEAFGLGSGDNLSPVDNMVGTTEEYSGVVSISETTTKTPWLLDQFYLPDCRITQTTSQHYQTGRGSMYATDIACIRDTPFDVKAPSFSEVYTIKDIGYNPQLGNYISIGWASGSVEYHIIFGHTQTQLKVGDKAGKGAIIGNTDKSGISTAVHLHAELWRGEDNLKRDFETVNDKSARVIAQRIEGIDNEYITQKVRQLECPNGYTLQSYRDHKQWSIGCGTKSHEGEVITAAEAETRMRQAVHDRITLLINDIVYDRMFTNNQRAALVSLYYNCPTCYNTVIKNPNRDIWLAHNKVCEGTGKLRKCTALGGLTKRRKAEWDLFISK